MLMREHDSFRFASSLFALLVLRFLSKALEKDWNKKRKKYNVLQTSLPSTVPLGKAQQPALWDYADGVDTLAFLSKL